MIKVIFFHCFDKEKKDFRIDYIEKWVRLCKGLNLWIYRGFE